MSGRIFRARSARLISAAPPEPRTDCSMSPGSGMMSTPWAVVNGP